MNVFAEKEKLFYEIYEETLKHAGADSGLFVERASINNYHPCCNVLDGVENVLNKYKATAKWKLFLENENLNCLMDDGTQALTAIAIAVAIKVFLCPEVEISFSFYVERFDERCVEYWWAISPSAPKGAGFYTKAQVECYQEYLRRGKEYIAEDTQVVVVNGVVKGYRGNDSVVVIPDTAKEIGERAFEYRNISSVIIPDSVEKIGDYAFSRSGITKIDIPDSVKTIGKGAFYLCKELNSVKIPVALNIMDDYLFCGCIELSSIELPEGVTKIGKSAFECCSKLESIALPRSLNEIGKTAFKDCKTLKTIAVNANLTKLVGGRFGEIFYHCFALSRVIPQEGIKTYKGSPLEKIWECIHSDYTEGADVNVLVSWLGEYFHIVKDDENALKKIKTYKSQIIDVCIKADNDIALVNLLSLFKTPKPEEISIYIEKATDKGSLTLKSALERYISDNYSEKQIAKLNVQKKNSGNVDDKTIKEWKKTFALDLVNDGIVITSYLGDDSVIEIPAVMEGKPVVAIASGVFWKPLKKIIIPNKNIMFSPRAYKEFLTYIGNKIVILDSIEGDTVEKSYWKTKPLKDGTLKIAYYFGYEDETINVPAEIDGKGVSTLGQRLFEGHLEIRDVIVPVDIKKIEKYCFQNSGLEKIGLPDGLEIIDGYAFALTRLKILDIPSSVTKIGGNIVGWATRKVIVRGNPNIPANIGITSSAELYAGEDTDIYKKYKGTGTKVYSLSELTSVY
ncbi:MAG: leucine-rich repeat protein [Clostridia bacterium]|nr:leucine-rich repeat protein [Clostridia bacterium]